MRVADLLEDPERRIEIRVEGPPGALARPITWCAPTESIDPSPFLTPGALMLTSGMALNVTDVRIWDAYVERLANVPIAALAFGLGPAHATLPEGLVVACGNRGVPLLVIPDQVPFVLVQREVQDRLSAERYEALRRGSELADDCTRIAADQGTMQDVLHRISEVVGARVSIQDSTGATLLAAGGEGSLAARTEFTLPGSNRDRFRLVVEETDAQTTIRTLLAPVAAVVSMQLSTTLGSAGVAHSRNAGRLTEAVYGNDAVPTAELIALARDAELEPYQRTGVVVLQAEAGMSTTYLRSVSWRARVVLAGEYSAMRFVEEPDLSTILLQSESLDPAQLPSAARAAVGQARSVSAVVATAENAAELGLVLRMCRRALGPSGVHAAPRLDFDAVVDTLRHPGAISLAQRLVAPLARSEELLTTLEAYLRHSGATPAICAELFIHRNTLAYRLKRIRELLALDLQDGRVRATLMMALRLA
ncbi:PucR family transcriptional regulator [Amycolatopsis sp. NPDC051903]|uniref:PucR family transcriptional regulator n=1 Tax=Amycolatopsis sp. NPDC051903 TaxID=3363936 RepID=UPI00378D7893